MFESADSREQWITDLEYQLKDLIKELDNNPFDIPGVNAVKEHVQNMLKEISKMR